MCGIAGIVAQDPSLTSQQLVEKGTALLEHRGPDDQRFYRDGNGRAVFGHRRLCIIDPSEGGAQPMQWQGRYTIVFNGELYNYIELREELRSKGCSFRSASDTEVVVAAYALMGEACLLLFDGMFAFAIWDEEKGELFAARDRMGEKPFFYAYDGEQLVFASTINALWAMGVQKEVNPSMLYNFIAVDYMSNPGDGSETFFEGVSKLPAASFMRLDMVRNELSLEKWWQVFPEENRSITDGEAVAHFTELFSASIQKRLRSDVPVGTSLSGGLDSSAVVAFCEEMAASGYGHQCFTASFPGFEKDELPYAQKVARHFGLKHHVVEINEGDVPQLMQRFMAYQEEPVISASPLVQFRLYEEAKRSGVTVLLDGQGADEILAGYHKYYKWYWMQLFREGKLSKSGELRAARELGVQTPFGWKEKLTATAPQFVMGIGQGRKAKTAYKNPDLNRDFAFAHKRNLYYSTPNGADLDSALYFNTFINGLEDLLRLADRNSMAHSVEVRLPFLQHELLSFLFTLPASFKIRNGWSKWLLREAVKGKLPEEITWRRDKIGYEPPQKAWMQQPTVQKAITEAKEVLVQQGILDASVLAQKIKPHASHVADNKDWKYWSAAFLFS